MKINFLRRYIIVVVLCSVAVAVDAVVDVTSSVVVAVVVAVVVGGNQSIPKKFNTRLLLYGV